MNETNQHMIFGLIFTVSNQLQISIDRTLKDDSLTAKQFFLMIVIGSFEKTPSLNDIAKRFGSSRQNAKQLLNKLVKNNYVKQSNDKADKRTLRFSLTPKAITYWEARNFGNEGRMLQLFEDMDEKMTKELFKGLSQLILNIAKMEERDENTSTL